ncbi:hypothetical protein ABW20_dc0100361 [Dactylellina cionopaga]|nr:hypothetical protein ABW20_dc0100361 [Dactylellina cionopaga]
MSSLQLTTITTLPPELFLTIFSHFPQRTVRTVTSPLTSITTTSPSKLAVQNISFASKTLRRICAPYVFEAVVIKSKAQLEEFVRDGGMGERIGWCIKRVVMRWDNNGAIVAKTIEEKEEERLLHGLVKKAIEAMTGLRSLIMDFPGAVDALSYTLSDETLPAIGERLVTVSVKNGRYEFDGGVSGLLSGLGRLKGLKSVVVDGTKSASSSSPSAFTSVPLVLNPCSAFKQLVRLDVSSLSSLDDQVLQGVLTAAEKLMALSLKSCERITLAGVRKILVEHGCRLRSLTLEIIKKNKAASEAATVPGDVGFELHDFAPDEHLCPAIRDYCTNLQTLELYTNKICKEILFSAADSKNGSGTMTGGLPTPPGSPELAPTRVADIPTPPVDAAALGVVEERTAMLLPPPLFSFHQLAYIYEKQQLGVQTVERREKMKRAVLRIPYDSSCFGKGAGGPSLQQVHTSLCDGLPAKELLEVGRKAFDEGLVEVVNVTGHWKGGPYLIMKD